MKKCPNCQKEFPDSMRFCQTDGTPLGDPIEESQPEDPLKTTVVRQEDIASAIPPTDPFKTMVAGSSNRDESGDLLQLPEQEFDPLKTMVATPIGQNKPILEEPKDETPKFEDIKEEIKSESSPAFGGFSQPSEPLPEAPKDYSNDPTVLQPEPPKFNEPSLNPPTFGDSSSKKEEDELPQTVMQNPWDNSPKSGQLPYSSESPYSNDSPFAKPGDSPMSSPFETPKAFDEQKSSFEEPKSTYEEPQSPFNQQSSSPFDSPFNQPQSSFDNQQQSGFDNQQQQSPFDNQPSSFEPQKQAFEEPPATQFGGGQFDQMNQGFGGANQQMQQQQSDWNPPTTPDQGWGAQGMGANTPIQPPIVGAGRNQTLAIVSIILGGLGLVSSIGLIIPFVGLLCFFGTPALGLGGIITGVMAKMRASRNPDQYGGSGLALGGIITGVLAILAVVALFIIGFLIGFAGAIAR